MTVAFTLSPNGTLTFQLIGSSQPQVVDLSDPFITGGYLVYRRVYLQSRFTLASGTFNIGPTIVKNAAAPAIMGVTVDYLIQILKMP